MQPVLCDHTSVELRFNSSRDLASSRRVCKHSESPDQTSQVAQANRNKLQHALHGNTVLSLDTLIPLGSPPGPSPNQPKQLNLTSLIPCPTSAAEPPQGMYPYSHTISKHTLLAMRTPTESLSPQLPQTTPLTTPASATTTPKGRTGRRRRAFSPNGTPIFYKINKKKLPNSRIRRIKTLVTPTTPPPRGVPGAPSGANEECTPTRAEQSATGGGTKRRLARRAYRRWCKGSTNTPLEGAGSPSEVRTSPTKATQRTSVWFRKTILWQDGIKRKAKKQQNTQLTTPPLSYGSKLRVGALNVQGFADTLKMKNVIQLMEEHNLDVITLSETRSTSYYSYTSEKHLVILSGNTRDKFAGVGAVIHPRVRPHLADIIQVSNRLLHLVFNKKGGKVHVLGAYAPHSGHDHDTVREPFWNKLEEYIDKIPQPEFVTLTGDFNVRFQAAHSSDQGVTGPYTYGKGKQWVDHTATGNRALCVRTMQRLHMVEAASYKTPSPTQQITYRDKAAPPTDWSQYLLDPLIMQQFYTHLQAKDPAQALTIASQIRAYLDLPQPLPPPKRQPTADPIRFQRLDHTFVRAQWLSGVNSCKSKLHTGFPSDHYLLVTEVQVKLAQRSKPSHPRVRYDFKQTTIDHQHSFNNTFRAALGAGPADTSQNTPQTRDPELRPHLRIYTDGSGTRGKATANTAAGWGWTYQDLDGEWVSASGPVITTRDHTSYLGAGVGSNNTGELTAIIEALLYCAETDHTSVQIVSDSQWAINVITGRWRSKAHKPMVQRAQHLYRKSGLKVNFKWTKAHVGTEGNEKADRLAEQGKRSETTTGGRTQPVLPLATTPHQAPQVSATQAVQAMAHAAKEHIPLATQVPRTPWITRETLQLLDQARKAEAAQSDDAKTLRNKAKRSARKDRVNWVHAQLLQDPSGTSSTVWNAVRRQKKGFVGKRSHLIVNNAPVPWSKTHEAMRDHLQNSQWKRPDITEELQARRQARPHLYPQHPDEQRFTLQELNDAIGSTKPNKAPGPDEVPTELFTILDQDSRELLLHLYNEIWDTATIPEDWGWAKIVSIFKGKGADTDAANYRPISLLNTSYKILAIMIQKRLANQFDGKLRSTQFGFRSHRSTSQPLFTVRRAMEWSLMTNTPLHLLFLDWKQAFDSIDHTAMLEALTRFGLSDVMVRLIASIYSAPKFTVQGYQGGLVEGSVSAGIRQGCPLSPYLFIMVLTVMLSDTDHTLQTQGIPTNTWSEGYPIYDLEYADDTLLMALTSTQLQGMLSALESVAQEYGMNLNQSKTEILTHPTSDHTSLKFREGTAVPTTTQVKYLGARISWINSFHTAFYHRLGLTEEAFKKLRMVWNSSLPRRTKVHIYHTAIVPVLLYGLDSLTLTDKMLKKIDGQYYRFLRRSIGIKASFYSRVTNKDVWEQAGKPVPASELLNWNQYKTLIEVFQQDRTQPTHSSIFCSAFKDRIVAQGRRRGMQFPYWIDTTTRRHFPQITDHTALSRNPHERYRTIARLVRDPSFEKAPKRAKQVRAGP